MRWSPQMRGKGCFFYTRVDSSTLAASVGGDVHFFSVGSLLNSWPCCIPNQTLQWGHKPTLHVPEVVSKKEYDGKDNYLEEAFKMRNLLEEFNEDHGVRPPTILGVREHIFTGRFVSRQQIGTSRTGWDTRKAKYI